MKKRFVSLLGLASVCLSLSAMPEGNSVSLDTNYSAQQNKVVKGRVIDQNGDAVIGASVLVKGTTRGTITDVDGNFSIDVAKGETLVISYIGYVNQEIVPTGKNLSKGRH